MGFILKAVTSLVMSAVSRWAPPARALLANPRVIIVALVGLLATAVKIEEVRLAAARQRGHSAALALSNLSAERDRTRDAATTNARVAHLLGDSLRLAEIRVLQIAQHGDALDKALGRERIARYVDDVAVDSLRRLSRAVSSTAPPDSNAKSSADGTVRSAFFDIRQAPYAVTAQVDIPAPPDSAQLELRVAIDPIPLEARVGCSDPDAQGIRTATVSGSTPPWATVTFGRVEQSPNVCGAPERAAVGHPHRQWFTKGLVIGGGRALTPSGWKWALFAGAGVGLRL